MNNAIEINNMTFSYESGKNILSELDLSLEASKFHAIIGENGAGKSTLLNLILSNYKANSGTIKIFGDEVSKNNHHQDISYISQNAVASYKQFPTTVEEVLKVHARYLKSKIDIEEKLREINLINQKKQKLSELSGGQIQRLALALSLIKDSRLIILDEPTSGIDKKFSKELFEKLAKLKKLGKTIIIVTHNLESVQNWLDSVIEIKGGKALSHSFLNGDIIDFGEEIRQWRVS